MIPRGSWVGPLFLTTLIDVEDNTFLTPLTYTPDKADIDTNFVHP